MPTFKRAKGQAKEYLFSSVSEKSLKQIIKQITFTAELLQWKHWYATWSLKTKT